METATTILCWQRKPCNWLCAELFGIARTKFQSLRTIVRGLSRLLSSTKSTSSTKTVTVSHYHTKNGKRKQVENRSPLDHHFWSLPSSSASNSLKFAAITTILRNVGACTRPRTFQQHCRENLKSHIRAAIHRVFDKKVFTSACMSNELTAG